MAFGQPTQEQQMAKMQKLIEKYGFGDMTDPRDFASAQKIAWNLAGNKLIELGAALQGKGPDAAKMSYLNALVEQNFIIIRQLDRIARKLGA
jgi:hypothetical protein